MMIKVAAPYHVVFLFVFFRAMFSRAVIPFDPFKDDHFAEHTQKGKQKSAFTMIFFIHFLSHSLSASHKRQPQVGVANDMEIYAKISDN